MKNFTIRQYQSSDFEQWNAFVAAAKNATFLFHRDFMEYHAERFKDFSLLVFSEGKLLAILPANVIESKVYSHSGLTYGGLVYQEKLRLKEIIFIFQTILSFLHENKIDVLQIKLLPSIYHQKPAQELDYVLFLVEAKLIRRDTLSVIDLSEKYNYSEIRKRGIKKAIAAKFEIHEDKNFDGFWNEILIPNLKKQHDASPVHSLEEIKLLQQNFPKNIRQFNVYDNEKIIAGTTIFETATTAHAQYISTDENREAAGSLDFLYDHLLKNVFKDKQYFDFGISNEEGGKKLNSGLSYWKESFGASTIVHDFYEVETANFKLFDNILL
ncbi:GNAT family N-acetyltransferase [Flavobacterium sp. 3HN19-14]|uniref:GNAT family N-acetyltransferase n=1 Tax=Flavobacterium sp. 3HN19-14 TaxID=3448133 RepID=UPI003EE23324